MAKRGAPFSSSRMSKLSTPLISSSSTSKWTYHVFLSFRGEDTRLNFTGNLYSALKEKGIHTFIDEAGLRRGEEITPSLLNAIQNSRIAIIVFSKNYASSSYCLEELVHILECSGAKSGRCVWPIFYNVDPSHVRYQKGTYAEALGTHERWHNKDKIQKWRSALHQAANLSGWHFQLGFESEYKFIKKIVEDISKEINRIPLHVDNPVGLESATLEVISLLELEYDVNMIGIYGIGGIGKTTIARVVYNLLAHQFDGVCFLANIREKATNNHGLVQLQEMLLSKILVENDIKVTDVAEGKSMIKWRLQQMKVLLILDDVDKLMQLEALAGECDWFGSGSKIIITTRDTQLLANHGVVNLHEAELLNDENAVELFSWHAFKSNKIAPSYEHISKRAILYACGLPLALKVIGSHLFGKSVDECDSAFDKYERTPHTNIHEILKVSYDGLEEDEKGIFLDIACFFNTYEIGYVKQMLCAHGFHAEDGIRVLTDRSLIKIDDCDFVIMHDLIQDMGREIVRQESRLEPGNRSRLWFEEDILHVLEEDTGSDKIEFIKLEVSNNKEVRWSGEAFKSMKNLRILITGNAFFSIGPKHLPNSLRVLDWSYYPSPFLPDDFNPKQLEILHMPESFLKFFEPQKMFQFLSLLNLEDSKLLDKLPSLHELQSLKNLCLDYCTNLVEIHESIGFLGNLQSLSAKGCTKLKSLVPYIKLKSLEILNLQRCSHIDRFPEILDKMEKIREIYLDETSIDKFPCSIGYLVGLERLYLRGCRMLNQLPITIHNLPKAEMVFGCGIGFEGFRIFTGYHSTEMFSSKTIDISPSAMLIYEDRPSFIPTILSRGPNCKVIDVYHSYIRPDNGIQVWTPTPLLCSDFEALLRNLTEPNVSHRETCRQSLMHFWFQKKFPKIVLCCCGRQVIYNRKAWLLDFKFSVFVNGTKQLSSSCNYITSGVKQILWCDLQCQAEGIFSECEWNQVEILCELKYPKPNSRREMNNHEENGQLWTLIGVYEKGNNKEDIKFENPTLNFLSPVRRPLFSVPGCLYYVMS